MPQDGTDQARSTDVAETNGASCKFIDQLFEEYKHKSSVPFEEAVKVMRAADECHLNLALGNMTKAELGLARAGLEAKTQSEKR